MEMAIKKVFFAFCILASLNLKKENIESIVDFQYRLDISDLREKFLNFKENHFKNVPKFTEC